MMKLDVFGEYRHTQIHRRTLNSIGMVDVLESRGGPVGRIECSTLNKGGGEENGNRVTVCSVPSEVRDFYPYTLRYITRRVRETHVPQVLS